MLKCLVEYGGLGLEKPIGKLVNIGCDGNNVFYNHKSRVTLQFKEKVAPFVTKGSLFCLENKPRHRHFVECAFGASIRIPFAKFICFLCSQPKKVC
jgi:hypothetical protein